MRRLSAMLLTILVTAFLLGGCRSGPTRTAGSGSPGATGSASPPTVAFFLASPDPVAPGRATSLAWALQGGERGLTCTLDTNGDGAPDVTLQPCPTTGSRSVTAPKAGRYRLTLTVKDASGRTASRTTDLRVAVPAAAGATTGAPGGTPPPPPGTSAAAPIWTKLLASDAADTVAGVAVTRGGDAVVVGFTAGSLEGASNAGGNDAFVARFGPDGSLRWLRQIGGAGDDRAMAVALSPAGDAYVAGQTSGTVPGGSSSGSGDAFLMKFDARGERRWVRQFGTSGADVAAGVAVGPSGNVVVAGDTNGTFPDNAYAGGDRDAFVAKFNASGDLMWLRQFGSAGTDVGRGVAVDAGGDAVVAGFTDGALPTNRSLGGTDAYLAKFDGNGQRVWVRQFGSDEADYGYAVAIAGGNDIVVAGDSYGDLPGSGRTGVIDGFAARFDANGNRLWMHAFGAKDAAVFVNGAAVADGGDIVLSGYANADLGGAGTQLGYFQVFALKLGPTGDRLWLRAFGRSGTELHTGAAVDAQGRVSVVGTGHVLGAGQSAAPGTGSGGSPGGASGTPSHGASGSAPETPSGTGPRHVLVVQYPP